MSYKGEEVTFCFSVTVLGERAVYDQVRDEYLSEFCMV